MLNRLEENKAVVRRFVEECLNRGNLAAADEIVARDFVLRLPGHPPIQGREAFKEGVRHWRSAFPDWQITIEDLIAEGDKVAGRWTVRGTHRGVLMNVPPTGKQVSWTANDIFRIANGKITENTAEEDMLTLMQQLGAVPERAQSLDEIDLMEVWFESDPTVRWKVGFPLAAVKGASSAVVYLVMEPGRANGTHTDSFEEVVFVLSGTLEAAVGDQREILRPGGVAVVQATKPHQLRNIGTTQARALGFFGSAAAVATFTEPVMPIGRTVLGFDLAK